MPKLLESIILPVATILILLGILYLLYINTSKNDKVMDMLLNKKCVVLNIPNEKNKQGIFCEKVDSNGKTYFEIQDK